MPISVKKVKDKFRLVEPDGSIAKNKKGTAIDGGGHSSRSDASKQARAIAMRKASYE
jgi:hypothetical protein